MSLFYYTKCVPNCLVDTIMKTEKIFVRLTEYEKLQLSQEAAKRGMTKSELIRSLIACFPAPSFKAD